jgi:pimeloyl-ACP methyl ester carboxylesterase
MTELRCSPRSSRSPPAQNAVAMSAQVPGSKLVQFEGAGHGLFYQDPRDWQAPSSSS